MQYGHWIPALALVAIVGGGTPSYAQDSPFAAPSQSSQQAVPASCSPGVAYDPSQVAPIGQPVTASAARVTVNAARRAAQAGRSLAPRDGRTYIIADVSLENIGQDLLHYNPLGFVAKDADGYEYRAALGADGQINAGDLPRGERVRGMVAFEVPSTARGLVIYLERSYTGGDRPSPRLALE
jgi:hypothetical protein